MTTTVHHAASVAVLLAAALLSATIDQQNGVASAECVECQLLLSHLAAPRSPAGIIIIIIIIIISVFLLCIRLRLA